MLDGAKQLIDEIRSTGKNVKIVGATKTRTHSEINDLATVGITAVGENRVQELLEKFEDITIPELHFIGGLQTNKVKYIVDKVSMIQSVDRQPLAQEIEKRCAKINKVMNVLIEVNIGQEQSKSGCNESEIEQLAKEISQMSHLKLQGLMSVLPIGAKRHMYERMKELYDSLKKTYPQMEYLSMGMSDDYMLAIDCGENLVRIGTALFGKRKYKE